MAHPIQEDSAVRKEIGSQMEGESFKWMSRYGPLGTCHWDSYLKVAKGESPTAMLGILSAKTLR